ncbi:MAG TPA: hypothetical protein PLW44_08605 [Chitinophagales bacterium]|nr:hypothetical protein [Chitinophagales bacterium]
MKFLSLLFGKQPTEAEILNAGLQLAMEFGENWLKPIQQRLFRRYNFLTKEELDKYNLICKTALEDGVRFIHNTLTNIDARQQYITENELRLELATFMRKKYGWINNQGIDRVFNQSSYHAWCEERQQRQKESAGYNIS